MNSLSMIPIPTVKLARKAWIRILALAFLALVGASGLGFYSYRLNRLADAVTTHQLATLQYQSRNLALESVAELGEIFNQYLLRGDPVLLQFMAQPRNRIEQLAQQEWNGRRDPILENLANEERKWYQQTVTPMVEARKKIPVGQPLPEHFLDQYEPVNTMGFLLASESAQISANGTMARAQIDARWLWLPYPLAGLLLIGAMFLTMSAFAKVNHLKQAAESDGEEENDGEKEDDGKELPVDYEKTKSEI